MGVVGHHGLEVCEGLVPGPGRRHQVAFHSGGRMGILGILGYHWMGLAGFLGHHWCNYEGSLGLLGLMGYHWRPSLLYLLMFFLMLLAFLLFLSSLFLVFLLFLPLQLTGRQGLERSVRRLAGGPGVAARRMTSYCIFWFGTHRGSHYRIFNDYKKVFLSPH